MSVGRPSSGRAGHWSHHSLTRPHQLLKLHLPRRSCRPPLVPPAGEFELTTSSNFHAAPSDSCAVSFLIPFILWANCGIQRLTGDHRQDTAASSTMASTEPQRVPLRERRPSTSAPIVDIQGSVSPAGISRPKHKRTFTGFGAGDIKTVEGGDTPILVPVLHRNSGAITEPGRGAGFLKEPTHSLP